MIIFLLLSIPLLILFIEENICFKSFVVFFEGILFSMFVSTIMWAFSTLYIPDSDMVVFKIIKDSFTYFFPLLFLFGTIYGLNAKQISLFIQNNFFIYGYLYMNLLFFILSHSDLRNSQIVIYLPFTYLVIVYIVYEINKKKLCNWILLCIPFFALIQLLLGFVSLVWGYLVILSIILIYTLVRKYKTA